MSANGTVEPVGPDGVRVRRGIVYGEGLVGHGRPGGTTLRELKLDLYEPAAPAAAPRPAIVLAFGGAFHRGTRESDAFEGGNTSIAEYCGRLASLGFVAASIDYRLVSEDPVPGDTPVIGDPDLIPTSRVSVVRTMLGLPPATSDMLWRGIEAATDDMAAAFRFVQGQASAWNVDPGRMATGGFSAGARIGLAAAFAEGIDARAVVSLSGFMGTAELERHVQGGRDGPAVLVISAENDLDYIRDGTPGMVRHLREAGTDVEAWTVPDADHFYPSGARTLPGPGERDGRTVGERVELFLDRTLVAGRG